MEKGLNATLHLPEINVSLKMCFYGFKKHCLPATKGLNYERSKSGNADWKSGKRTRHAIPGRKYCGSKIFSGYNRIIQGQKREAYIPDGVAYNCAMAGPCRTGTKIPA